MFYINFLAVIRTTSLRLVFVCGDAAISITDKSFFIAKAISCIIISAFGATIVAPMIFFSLLQRIFTKPALKLLNKPAVVSPSSVIAEAYFTLEQERYSYNLITMKDLLAH